MNNISTTITSVLTALFLPLTISANPINNQSERQEVPEDNIEAIMNTVEDPTTAFIDLSNSPQYDYSTPESSVFADDVIDYARKYLGTPYVYGSKGPRSFDCSGFTSYIFRKFDIKLSPDSRAQATQGRRVSVQDIRPGDLLFFSGRAGGSRVGHVAMAVDVNDDGSIKFIHASTRKGVTYNNYPNDAYYRQHFLHARRVLEE